MYYALWVGSIELSQLSGWHLFIINLCLYIWKPCLNNHCTSSAPLPPRKLNWRPKESWQSQEWSEVQTTVEYFFGEIKTYKFVDFTLPLKIGLSSVERIYLKYEIVEKARSCLYGSKADDVFETNPITDYILRSAAARSSRPEVLSKKSVPENFAKFTGKHLYQWPFLK